MKVSDLFEVKLDIPTSKKPLSKFLQHPKLSHLGTGVQAIAHQHTAKPGTVVKTIFVSGSDDPSYQFLRVIKTIQTILFFLVSFRLRCIELIGAANGNITGMFTMLMSLECLQH